MKLFTLDAIIGQLERAMDVMSYRAQMTSSNVANLDTPGYRTKDIDFNRALQDAMRAEDLADLERAARSQPLPGLVVRHDGNNVNIEREMLALAQTRHRYEAATQFVRLKLRQVRSALSEGRVG